MTPGINTEAPPLPGISADQINNSKYQLGFPDALRVVQLVNGVYQEGLPGDPSFVIIEMSDFIALGDIDNDGINEAAALITEKYDDSSVFVFLTLYREVNGAPQFITSIYVDDQPIVNGIGFENSEIYLWVTTHQQDDPVCCPTFQNERRYDLINNQLKLINYLTYTPDGRSRIIAIETPENGAEVSNVVSVSGHVDIAPFENNLAYRILDLGGVELSVGAITVNADNLGGAGTFSADVPLGEVLSGTVLRIEIQDRSAQDGSLLAMDSVQFVVK